MDKIGWPIAFIVLVTIESSRGSEGCRVEYRRKGCASFIVEGVIVYCKGQDSNHIPTSIPIDVVYLSLKNYSFKTTWDKNQFKKFVKLECLYVSHSEILGIREDAFSENLNLKEVAFTHIEELSGESLSFIHNVNSKINHLSIENTRDLSSLPKNDDDNYISKNLKSLILRGNSLQSFPNEFYSTFRYLELLDLSNNSLKGLNWGKMLESLKYLNELRLNDNAFQTISQSALPLFLTVNKIYLGNNRFHCNCYLQWLKDYFEKHGDHRTLDDNQVNCFNYNNNSIRTTPDPKFHCSRPSIPIIIWKALDNKNIEFNCSSYADPAPDITIHLTDHISNSNGYTGNNDFSRTVIVPATNDSSKLRTISPRILVGSSLIRCEARNFVGNTVFETLVETLKNGSWKITTASSSSSSSIILIAIIIIEICILN